jgi:hypothetical protein
MREEGATMFDDQQEEIMAQIKTIIDDRFGGNQ